MSSDWQSGLLVGLGIVVITLSFSFPMWSLASYTVTVEPVDDPPEGAAEMAVSDLTDRERTVFETALERDRGATMYGSWSAHQSSDSELPFADHWIDDYTLGAVITDGDDEYLLTYDSGGAPFHVPFVVVGGAIMGALIAFLGRSERWIAGRDRGGWGTNLPLAIGVVLTVVAILGLGLFGNASGHLFPVQ